MGIYQNINKLIEQELGNINASNSIMVNTYNDLQTLSDKKEGVFYITKDNDEVYLYDPTSLGFINVTANVSGASIDDVTPSTATTYSSQKTEDKLSQKAEANHSHTELHSHTNKAELDRLGINAEGKLTIDDVELPTGTGEGGPAIDDVTPSSTTVYSSQKVEDELVQKAEANHTHTELHQHTNKSSLDRLAVNETGNLTIDGVEIPTGEGGSGASINDVTPSTTETYSSQKIEDELAGKADSGHLHDEYLTQSEADLLYNNGAEIDDTTSSGTKTYSSQKIESALSGKSPTGHTHSEYSPTSHNHSGVYEPVISTKNTAFNKNFGGNGTSTDVARADHTHVDYTTVAAVNDIIEGAVSLRDEKITMTGTIQVGNEVYLETEYDGIPISIPVNVVALPIPSTQNGTAEFPYVIASIDDFNTAKTKPNALTSYWKLWTSLDFANATIEPLFTGIFEGNFEGGNKILRNFKISKPTITNVGLFYSNKGTIQNLIIDNGDVDSNENGGVLVGQNYFTASPVKTGLIDKCSVLNSKITGVAQIGMLAGFNSAVVKKSFAQGVLTGKSGSRYCGGLVGQVNGANTLIEDSGAVVNLVGITNYGASSLIGGSSGGNPVVTRSYGAGSITGAATNKAGVLGYVPSGTPSFTNCYYDKTLNTNAETRATGLFTSEFTDTSKFVNFNFDTVWEMDATLGRPVPRGQEEPAVEPEFTQEVADTLYSPIEHNHDTTYAPLIHSHSEYKTETQVNTLIKNADKFLNVKDFSNDIQAALNESKTNGLKNIVFVPNGTYRLNTALKIPSDTTLLLDKEAIITRANGTMNNLIINDSDGTVGGYEANKNINIIGGIFDGNKGEFNTACTILAFGHAKNIVIKNAVFRNLYDWHLIELNGVENALITENYFENNGDLGTIGTEMIQIDVFSEAAVFPWFGPYDSTPCKAITIENNFFKDGMIAIGTHSHVVNVKHKNIKIKNNHFQNFYKEIIAFKNWEDVYFEHNYLDNAFKGFKVFTDGTTTCENINVLYNTFRNMNKDATGRAVEIKSTETNEKLKKVRVIGNTVDTTGSHAVGADFSDDVIFKDNNIQNAPGVGLWVYGIDNCIVQNNTIKNTNTNNVADRGDIVLGLTTKIPKNIICKDNLVGKLVVNGIQKSIVKDNIVSSIVNLNNDASVIVDNNIIGG